ncbi:uncharacterized protein LOC134676163 isoform X4 [Cydia fagiglandana]|uniref:uncharacterized protein LOC134676163 isoform X4 n=1 Tax=Cydia fagiglandana TaxID=1458189 RepID=UPI002FEE2919
MIDDAVIDAMEVLHSCRCCLRQPPDKDLKKPYTHLGKTEIYSDILEQCFDIRLSLDNDDECGICETCVERLRDARSFKLQVQNSQAELQKRLDRVLHAMDGGPEGGSKMEEQDQPNSVPRSHGQPETEVVQQQEVIGDSVSCNKEALDVLKYREAASSSEAESGKISVAIPIEKGSNEINAGISESLIELKTLATCTLSKIETIEKRMALFSSNEQNNADSLCHRLPLKTLPDLEKLELEIQQSEIMKNQLINNLSLVGGNTTTTITRRILQRLFSTALALQCNWTGKNNKFSLKQLLLTEVIINAVRRNKLSENAKDIEITKALTNWFRFAKDRDGGRENRRSFNTRQRRE